MAAVAAATAAATAAAPTTTTCPALAQYFTCRLNFEGGKFFISLLSNVLLVARGGTASGRDWYETIFRLDTYLSETTIPT